VLEAYLGGQAVGGATVDVLSGAVNPSGRLPESFPLHLEDNPSYLWYGGEKDTAEYREGVFVGYRWYDKKAMPVLFPFGHGLSYTTFRYENLRLSAAEMWDTDTLTVSVDVTNTGLVPGKEVVQLYIADRESTVIRPARELKEFAKVSIAPGETQTVRFSLGKRAFAYWNTTLHDWHVETGVFAVQIGRSSRDIALEKEVTVLSTVALPQKVTLDTIFMDLLPDPISAAILQPLIDKSGIGVMDDSPAGREAITAEMQAAILHYMPLRAMVSFAGGKITFTDLNAVVEQLNRPRA